MTTRRLSDVRARVLECVQGYANPPKPGLLALALDYWRCNPNTEHFAWSEGQIAEDLRKMRAAESPFGVANRSRDDLVSVCENLVEGVVRGSRCPLCEDEIRLQNRDDALDWLNGELTSCRQCEWDLEERLSDQAVGGR